MKLFVFFSLYLFSATIYANQDYLALEKRIIDIYQKNVPSVVNVANIKIAKNLWYGDEVEIPQGAGTGFVWDLEGHIVTNYHVVEGGNTFVISFHNDRKQYSAKVVGVSPNNDIAVLKIKKKKVLKAISIGSSESLKVGQLALAIGNPLGFAYSLSRGIVSALGRKMDGIGGVKINDMVQTDAAINQGNSGGPLIDSSGQLIGMNTLIVSQSGSSAGLGFAVPVDTIKRIVPQLILHGKVIRPGLGIGVLENYLRRRYVGKKGVALSFVEPTGAAGKAGLKGMMRDKYGRMYLGDVILKVNGKEVNSRDDIYQVLENKKIGDSVKVLYLRDGKKKKTIVTLREL